VGLGQRLEEKFLAPTGDQTTFIHSADTTLIELLGSSFFSSAS
jgi:hypothetical protein